MNKFYTVLVVLGTLLLLGTSCSKESPKSDGEEITVHLNLGGEFDVNVEQDPITKGASTNDAYGLNVYYDKEGDGEPNDIYAYGLFDNTGDMTITLLSNHKYKVYCCLVKDARNTLFYGQAFNNTYSGYAYPFQTTSSGSTLVENQFIIGSGRYLNGLGTGTAHTKGITTPSSSNAVSYASLNRYYGVSEVYEPVPNGSIDIYLKRVVFGAKFVVTGVQEGSAAITAGDFFSQTYVSDSEGTETLYTFPSPSSVYEEDLPLVATVKIAYTSDRGPLWNLTQSQQLQFKRNIMTTVNIQLHPDLSRADISLTEEEFGDENVIDLGINTDGLIDIIVNPEN